MLAEMITGKVWKISRADLEIRRAYISRELGVCQDPQKELQNAHSETNTVETDGFKFLKTPP